MKALSIIPIAAIMLGGASVQAQETSPERLAEFNAVMAQNSCRMTDVTAGQIMPTAGFGDKAEVTAIMGELLSEGRASLVDGQFILHAETCGAEPDYTTRERFLAAVAFNGCAMTAQDSNELLPPVGIKRGEIKPLIGRMMSMGEIQLSEDEQQVFVEETLCDSFAGMAESIAGAEMTAATERLATARALSDGLKQEFLAYMQTVECKISQAQFMEELPGLGFDPDQIQGVIDTLMIEGIVDDGEGHDMIIVTEGNCG